MLKLDSITPEFSLRRGISIMLSGNLKQFGGFTSVGAGSPRAYLAKPWFTTSVFHLSRKHLVINSIIDNLHAWYMTFRELKRPFCGSVIEISRFDT
jgi:hypothetical protein